MQGKALALTGVRAFCFIKVSKGNFEFFDWQIAQSITCFAPLSGNKKIYVCLW